MKRKRVRLMRRAQADLRGIEIYLTYESPTNGARVYGRLLDAIESLERFSSRTATPRDERVRKRGFRMLIKRPYIVLLRIHSAEVRVHRVVHGRRAYQHLL